MLQRIVEKVAKSREYAGWMHKRSDFLLFSTVVQGSMYTYTKN